MKKIYPPIILLTFATLLFGTILPVRAQDEAALRLRLSKDFGFSSGTGQIQGTFSMKAEGPEDLARVVFLIDDAVIAEDTEPPFRVQFRTDGYPQGVHTLSAAGYTHTDQQLVSNEIRNEFVSPDAGWQTTLKIMAPILGLVLVVSVLSFVVPGILGRGKTGATPLGSPRSYGMIGGTICSKCGRPFGMHIWGINLLVGKLDRCPHCGRWSLARRAFPAQLRAAELAELESVETDAPEPTITETERLSREIENSRYEDI